MSRTPEISQNLIDNGAPAGSILEGISPRNKGLAIMLLKDLPPDKGGKGGWMPDNFRIISLGSSTTKAQEALKRAQYEGLLRPGFEITAKAATSILRLRHPDLTHYFNLNGLALRSYPALAIAEPEQDLNKELAAPAKATKGKGKKPALISPERAAEQAKQAALQAEIDNF